MYRHNTSHIARKDVTLCKACWEVVGDLRAILVRSWMVWCSIGWCWGGLKDILDGLGAVLDGLGVVLGGLGMSWSGLGRSWVVFSQSLSGLGLSWGGFGWSWGGLGRECWFWIGFITVCPPPLDGSHPRTSGGSGNGFGDQGLHRGGTKQLGCTNLATWLLSTWLLCTSLVSCYQGIATL